MSARSKRNPRVGRTFIGFLGSEGIKEEVDALAKKKIARLDKAKAKKSKMAREVDATIAKLVAAKKRRNPPIGSTKALLDGFVARVKATRAKPLKLHRWADVRDKKARSMTTGERKPPRVLTYGEWLKREGHEAPQEFDAGKATDGELLAERLWQQDVLARAEAERRDMDYAYAKSEEQIALIRLELGRRKFERDMKAKGSKT